MHMITTPDLVDTHCHLDVDAFDPDRDEVLARSRQAGVRRIVIPGVEAEHWEASLALCAAAAGLYPALGLHPVYLDRHAENDVAALETAIDRRRPVAVGEIGLDYFVPGLDRDAQQALFEAQLAVARDAGLPVLLHVRKAHDQVLATLRRVGVRGGIAHAFNGSLQQAQKYLERGFKLGFGGTLTYERSRKIRAVARDLPLESIVLETDAPDIVVASHRGERNSPEYLPECLAALAEVRDEDALALAAATTRNACSVLGLDRQWGQS
jgi:TatD DNase family protein